MSTTGKSLSSHRPASPDSLRRSSLAQHLVTSSSYRLVPPAPTIQVHHTKAASSGSAATPRSHLLPAPCEPSWAHTRESHTSSWYAARRRNAVHLAVGESEARVPEVDETTRARRREKCERRARWATRAAVGTMARGSVAGGAV